MMKKLLLYTMMAGAMVLASCSDEEETFDVMPTGGVEFTPKPGGAVMTYQLPNNTAIKAIRVRYNDVNNKEVVVMGSYLEKSLELVGFNEARTNVPIHISYVDKNGVMSKEFDTTFSTADSGPYAFFKTAEVNPSWNGFTLDYELPEEGMNGYAHVFYVGTNPNTQKTDILLLSSFTISKGKVSKYFAMQQQQSDVNTIVVKTEDFRGYFVKTQVWEGVKSYPTRQYPSENLKVTCPKSVENTSRKIGLQYLTDGDNKGLQAVRGKYNEYYTFAMGPFAFGSDIIVELAEPEVISSARIYGQFKVKQSYSSPVWNMNYTDTLPCEVEVYGSNDMSSWTQLGYYSAPADQSGDVWWDERNMLQRVGKVGEEELVASDPVYLDITAPISTDTYKYVKVVPVQTFDWQVEWFKNTNQYVTMQELEIYVKK